MMREHYNTYEDPMSSFAEEDSQGGFCKSYDFFWQVEFRVGNLWRKLSLAEQSVLAHIARGYFWAMKNSSPLDEAGYPYFYISKGHLAERACVVRSALYKAIDVLSELNIIEVSHQGKNKVSRIYLLKNFDRLTSGSIKKVYRKDGLNCARHSETFMDRKGQNTLSVLSVDTKNDDSVLSVDTKGQFQCPLSGHDIDRPIIHIDRVKPLDNYSGANAVKNCSDPPAPESKEETQKGNGSPCGDRQEKMDGYDLAEPIPSQVVLDELMSALFRRGHRLRGIFGLSEANQLKDTLGELIGQEPKLDDISFTIDYLISLSQGAGYSYMSAKYILNPSRLAKALRNRGIDHVDQRLWSLAGALP